MIYAAMNYNKQYRNYQKEKKGLFKLLPLITVVIYYGEDEWKNELYLKELIKDLPESFKELIQDWHTKVIDIKKIDSSIFKNKDNRDLIKTVQIFYESNAKIENIKKMKARKLMCVNRGKSLRKE